MKVIKKVSKRLLDVQKVAISATMPDASASAGNADRAKAGTAFRPLETTLEEELEEAGDEAQAAHEAADNPAVIAEDTRELHTLTVGEATMSLDLEGGAVLVFRNRASQAINVVYRRTDGHIGWIDPAG